MKMVRYNELEEVVAASDRTLEIGQIRKIARRIQEYLDLYYERMGKNG